MAEHSNDDWDCVIRRSNRCGYGSSPSANDVSQQLVAIMPLSPYLIFDSSILPVGTTMLDSIDREAIVLRPLDIVDEKLILTTNS